MSSVRKILNEQYMHCRVTCTMVGQWEKLKSILKIFVQGFGLLSVLKTKKQGLWYVVNDTKTYFLS